MCVCVSTSVTKSFECGGHRGLRGDPCKRTCNFNNCLKLQMCEQPLIKQYNCADSLTFRFHRHFSLGIELTENQCQSVCVGVRADCSTVHVACVEADCFVIQKPWNKLVEATSATHSWTQTCKSFNPKNVYAYLGIHS